MAAVTDANYNPRSQSAFGWQYLHQGGRLDPVTGWYNFRNRDLIATEGRWAERDPLGFAAGSLDLYGYVGSNPTNRLDPEGLSWISSASRFFRQAIVGIWGVGPGGAYDAAYGYYQDHAQEFSVEVYPNSSGAPGDDSLGWQRNAARHAFWQSTLTAAFGIRKAKIIGDAHECGAVDSLDSWIDQYNNEKARAIGLEELKAERYSAQYENRDMSYNNVESRIRNRLKWELSHGTFITSPNDPRIPPGLSPVPGGGNASPGSSPYS